MIVCVRVCVRVRECVCICVRECISLCTIWHITLLLIVRQGSRQICAFVREGQQGGRGQRGGSETPVSIFELNKRGSNLDMYLYTCVYILIYLCPRAQEVACVCTYLSL